MEVTFLGTGNAFGSGGRHSLSILVQTGGFGVLLDCGAATLPTLKRLGLSPQSVDCVLISHHHGDHFGGVPFLLLEYQYETLRKKPLSVIGPPGTGQKITQLTELLFPGLKTKSPGYELTYVDMDAVGSRQLGPVEVLPFRVHHFPEGIAFGYRISTEGRTVVYSGDTEWTDELGCRSQEADLFICECSSLERKIPFHMSHKELESHRDRIGAKRTLLVHAGDDVLARRSDLIFELAEDGQKVRLG